MTSGMRELKVVNSNGYVPTEEKVVDSNGDVLTEEKRSYPGLRNKASSPTDPAWISEAGISEESLSAAEEAAEQVLKCVHSTLDSEEKRRDIIDYVQRLVKSRLNCEAVSYGSVPLKTYLPDGDIDLTILNVPNAEQCLAKDVLCILEDEEHNQNAEYQVKDTQFIDAEVKLVKCLVGNIVVDITFNQLGGLSTLCFLEQVDRLVGRHHLFKRSIILVKTWCYYESRILGAHHGLVSTYALETLILYIFHFFHSSLSGPLAVLYRFLDYYSKFDWEKYCISLRGPVHISSLPDIVVKMPENRLNHLLLGEEFLENCMDMFSVPFRGPEANQKAFQQKHLNIIDPLKENNNLGRSVHRGNFYRIRSAFRYGAHKLGQALMCPRHEVADEIHKFFSNTCARHENQHATSTRHLVQKFSDRESLTASLSSPLELFSEDDVLKSSASDFDNDSVGLEPTDIVDFGGELDRFSIKDVSSKMASEAYHSADGTFVSGHCIVGRKYGLATSASFPDNYFHKLHHFTSKSSTENGSSKDQQTDLADSEKSGFSLWLNNREEKAGLDNRFRSCMDNPEAVCNCITGSNSTPEATILDYLSLDFKVDLKSVGGESEALNPLADLTGDYDSNIRSLLSAQLCHRFALSAAPKVINPPLSLSRIQNKRKCDTVRRSTSLKENEFSQMDTNIISKNHIMLADSDSSLSGTGFHFEGTQKSRGTGTYFPHVMQSACHVVRPLHSRGRNYPLSSHNPLHTYHSNGLYPTGESKSFENGTHNVLLTRKRYQGQRRRSDAGCQSPRTIGGGYQINGRLGSSCRIEFGSVGNLAEEMISSSAHGRFSAMGGSLEAQDSAALSMQDRVAGQSIHLDEDEFPPLCL